GTCRRLVRHAVVHAAAATPLHPRRRMDGRSGVARRADDRPPRRARDGRAPRRRRRRVRARAPRLRQPPFRPAVRDGARRQSARGHPSNRVVNRELAEAYARCERLAQSHYENFPVASRLLPAPMRPHIAASYAFARLADDMADEGERPAAARIADLDAWEARLAAAVRGEAAGSGPHAGIFLALRHTIEVCGLPPSLLHDLISAFRQDVSVKRYAAWEDLLDYCPRSANPV